MSLGRVIATLASWLPWRRRAVRRHDRANGPVVINWEKKETIHVFGSTRKDQL